MKVLAIDPGNVKSAFVVWDGKTILDKGILDNEEMIEYAGAYDNLVVEMIASYGMAVGRTVFDTCVWIGRFIEAMSPSGKFDLVYRKDAKMHLCHTMKAKDGNIRQALIDRFEPTLEPKKRPYGVLKGVSADIWAALAVAVYYYDTKNAKNT